jgi:phosphoserine phosphatase
MQKNPKYAILFDVDGVITDPTAKKITVKGLAEAIADRINSDDIVSFNTGRSVSWLIEHDVIGSIERNVSDKDKLSDIIAIGEKGGTWATFEEGYLKNFKDESIKIPKKLQDEIRALIESEFSDSMFYDSSKLTMISTEMIDGYPIGEYSERQKQLIPEINKILKKPSYLHLDLRVDPTIIAVDIQNSHVGKHLGARRILDWLGKKSITPKHFITIGDSQSDVEMAEELQDKYSTEFVFVGDSEKLDKSALHCPVILTGKRFAEGTLEYLKSL